MNELTVDRAMEVARKVLAAADEAAVAVAVVIVDATARPVLSIRPPDVAPLIESAARRKAAAAAAFGAPTSVLAEMFAGDALLANAFSGSDDLLVLPGGFPLPGSGGVAGAVGISGGHYSTDQAIGENALGS